MVDRSKQEQSVASFARPERRSALVGLLWCVFEEDLDTVEVADTIRNPVLALNQIRDVKPIGRSGPLDV